MKILFTSHRFYPFIGGIEVNSEILARYFSSKGHEVHVVTNTNGGEDASFPFPVTRRPTLKRLVSLHRWADVVYQNNIELGALWPVFFTRKPTVISVRTWLRAHDGKTRPVDRLKKWVLSRADAVIAISEAIRKETCARAVVIGNPYRANLFRVLPDVRRSNSVAFLGRFVSDKGADLLIRAYAEVKSQAEGLTLIGGGPEESSLKRMASDLGVEARFTGPLQGEDLVRELNQHSILAVPSRWAEPFGNVALEGMACGCVVVGSDGGGLPDAIGDGGVIYAGGDGHALAMALRSCLADLSLRERCLKRAARHLSNHTEETVSAKYLNLIASVNNNMAARESGS
jgi:glycosyltransferase involved in cell wall biosynthesis